MLKIFQLRTYRIHLIDWIIQTFKNTCYVSPNLVVLLYDEDKMPSIQFQLEKPS